MYARVHEEPVRRPTTKKRPAVTDKPPKEQEKLYIPPRRTKGPLRISTPEPRQVRKEDPKKAKERNQRLAILEAQMRGIRAERKSVMEEIDTEEGFLHEDYTLLLSDQQAVLFKQALLSNRLDSYLMKARKKRLDKGKGRAD